MNQISEVNNIDIFCYCRYQPRYYISCSFDCNRCNFNHTELNMTIFTATHQNTQNQYKFAKWNKEKHHITNHCVIWSQQTTREKSVQLEYKIKKIYLFYHRINMLSANYMCQPQTHTIIVYFLFFSCRVWYSLCYLNIFSILGDR